ncbi:MAG TPA: hypothetical protein VH986_04425 [Acidimicrobiia bacterium]
MIGLLVAAFVLVGTVLRVWGVGNGRLGYDEAFTAMAGRLPLGDLLRHLRLDDSHPPLDYLLRAPLARAGVDPFWFRMPSVVCSVAALACLGWWLRRYGVAGVVATGLFAVSAFELVHGRTARMYSELELFGVLAAVLAFIWLERPRRWHAAALAALVVATLLTHVSGFLLAAGLLGVAGLRRDRDAWRWRLAIVCAGLAWAVLWGPSFLEQARGGHSDWIPRTTPSGVVHTFGNLVSYDARLHAFVLLAAVGGAVVVCRRDARLGRVLVCCSFAPMLLAAIAGTVAPVLLDRALTVAAWGPTTAIAFLLAALLSRSRVLGVAALVAVALVVVTAAVDVVQTGSGPNRVLGHLSAIARPGDIVATRPAGKLAEIEWSLGVRGRYPYHTVEVDGLGNTAGMLVGDGPWSGRTWLLDWTHRPLPTGEGAPCAPTWYGSGGRVLCIR